MFLQNHAIDQVDGYVAAGVAPQSSDILDMSGYDGVVFVAGFGTLIEAGTLDVYVEQNTANQAGGMARLATTTAHTVTAGNALLTQSCIVVDVYRPQERYVRCVVDPSDQNAVILGVVAIRYKGAKAPVTQGTNVLKTTQLVAPTQA
jgi:hypothetical protein